MAAARGTILIVDDEPDIRAMLELGLESDGYVTLAADCGERAIELFKVHRADLVICDIRMPGIGGLATISALRAHDPEVPVIIASGYLAPRTIEQSKGLGGVVFIRKPFLFRELLSEVHRRCGSTTT
jgi:CheY-like chemotaxis protein